MVGSFATVPPGTVSSVPSPTGEEVASEAREVHSFIGWNLFQLKCIISLGTWTQ